MPCSELTVRGSVRHRNVREQLLIALPCLVAFIGASVTLRKREGRAVRVRFELARIGGAVAGLGMVAVLRANHISWLGNLLVSFVAVGVALLVQRLRRHRSAAREGSTPL